MFVVFEGIDGCGKTTQSGRVARWLADERGADAVLCTREPGGWPGGEAVREFVLNRGFASVWSEFFLFMMDRCEHVARVIAPALDAGKIVLSDRYMPSSLAYQILENQSISPATKDYIVQLENRIGLPEPDVVFWLDVSVEAGAQRLSSRGKRDAFDMRGADFFERVRAGYEKLMHARRERGIWIRIDGSGPEEEVFDKIKAHLSGMKGILPV